jgi:hypothetical protein
MSLRTLDEWQALWAMARVPFAGSRMLRAVSRAAGTVIPRPTAEGE